MFGMLISIGTTAFDPYAKENEVALVEVFVVVLYDYKTPGSSSAHLPFRMFEPFSECIDYSFVHRFNLAVQLGMSWGSKGKLYVPFGTKILKCEVDELRPIVYDYFVRDSKPANDIFPDKCFLPRCL